MRGKRYSPEDIERGLQALAETPDSPTAAAKATGIPRTTLIGWKKEHFDEFDALRREKRADLIGEVWAAAGEALAALRTQFPRMKGRDLAVTLGILIDKALILGGEPSEITETKTGDATDRLLAALEREVADSRLRIKTETEAATAE